MRNIAILDEDTIVYELVVVASDMCSSSRILEDLTRTGSLKQYDRMLKNLQLWLAANAESSGFVLYKFTGDGWILLFPADAVTGKGLMSFLLRFCKKHKHLRQQFVDEHLESSPESVGLTLGIDAGPVRKLILGNEVEFVGRPINVACRLQTAVKDKKPGPDYRCLMSRKVYNTYMTDVEDFYFGAADRVLRNITGGEKYQCYKVDFSRAMQ